MSSVPPLDRADFLGLHDIPEMSVGQHHASCLGVLALCYRHVPAELQAAIFEAVEAAKEMGGQVEPTNLYRGLPLAMNQ